MNLSKRKVCAVCGHVLNLVSGQGWIHGLGDPGLWDHAAVPVDETEVSVNAVCDFCYRPDPPWVIPSSDFVSIFAHAGADWTACDDCCQLVEKNDWNGLMRRVEKSWASRHGEMPEEVQRYLRGLYRQLRKHITGTPYRV